MAGARPATAKALPPTVALIVRRHRGRSVQGRDVAATAAGLGVAVTVLTLLVVLTGGEAVLTALGRAVPPLVAAVAAAVLAWLCLWGLALRAVLSEIGRASCRERV